MLKLKLTQRKTLERLGIPYTEERIAWRGNRKYGFRPLMALIIDDAGETAYLQYREATADKRHKAKERRKMAADKIAEERAELAYSLGVLPDSRTFASYLAGEIDEEECRRIGRITADRHENTNYDDLLRKGYSKEDAREFMER